jgi:ankyrin repeat protein
LHEGELAAARRHVVLRSPVADTDGWTPLKIAMLRGHAEVIALLVAAGVVE